MHGQPLTVNGRAFDVLVSLVRRRGQLATKQSLLDEVWPGIAVEEHNVTTQVSNIRKLLETHDPATNYIVTDAGRGYRFVADVTLPRAAAPAPPELPKSPPSFPEIPVTIDPSGIAEATAAAPPPEEQERRLAAILVADIVGFSRMIGEDEAGTLAHMDRVRSDIVDPTVRMFRGRVFKEMGDGLLVEFASAVQALSAALRIQEKVAVLNARVACATPINFRIAVHQGDVLVRGSDLVGDGVNVAARLEPLADVGGICISDRVRIDVAGKLRLEFEDLGLRTLKNISRPVQVHRVRDPLAPSPPAPAPAPDRPPTTTAAPPPRDGAAGPEPLNNLPREVTSFIGREVELDEVTRILLERRRLTLVGAGGVGKTRAALRVGERARDAFRDGVWLVELAPLADPGLVAEAVCRVVSAPVSGTRAPVEVATVFLRGKQLLLILDTCEHLLSGAAELATALLSNCPDVSILATSREPLRIPGEVVYRLPSLPVPAPPEGRAAADAMQFAAVRLFVQRAADAAGGYVLTETDAPFVSAICRRLDGVPMAIELAAARRTVLKPAEIAARLENAFRLLNSGGKAALPRHQTLWATIDWSHSLLHPAEQVLFRRLSVFVDGFSVQGATAAAQGDGIEADDVLDLLELLIDKSLVNADMSGSATRFRMLEATRHYAREKLKASGETGRDRLAAEFLADFYAEAEAAWPTTATVPWLAQFAPEVENLRAAIDWAFGQSSKYHAVAGETGDPALGVRLVSHAGAIADELSLQADLKRWTQAALPFLTPATPALQAGWVRFWANKSSLFGASELRAERREAIALFRAAGDPVGLSCALRTAAMSLVRPGKMHPDVEPMLTEAVALLRPLPPTKDLATAIAHLGSFHFFAGDLAAARRYNLEAITMRRALGDRTGCLSSALNLAEFESMGGNIGAAIDYARQAAADARRAGYLPTLASLLANLAGYLLATDRIGEARAAGSEALTLMRALGHHDYALPCLEHLALAHALSGAHADAARLLGHTEAGYRRADLVRDFSEQRGHDRLAKILREKLESTLSALMAEGAAWPDAVADRVAQCNDSVDDPLASASAA